jgi:hypothetical protein
MTLHRPLLLAGLLLASLSAVAQYQWIDKDGRRVFSDRAPPADIPVKNILSQPRGGAGRRTRRGRGCHAGGIGNGDGRQGPGAGRRQGAGRQEKAGRGGRRRQAKGRRGAQAAARADNCKRAQGAKATLDSGMRMARVNAQGEREVLDDAQRAAELKRVNEIIAASCK